jgi:hypothetical protein
MPEQPFVPALTRHRHVKMFENGSFYLQSISDEQSAGDPSPGWTALAIG